MNLRLLFLGPLIFGAALAAAPPLRPNPNLAKAIDEADLIIVGKVQQGTAYAIGTEMSSDLVLRIERVLKGSAIVGTDIAAVLKGRGAFIIPNGSTNKVPAFYGIWFLKETAGGPYMVVPRMPEMGEPGEASVFLPAEAPPGAPGSSPADAVANEIAAGLHWLAQAHSADLKPKVLEQVVGDRKVPNYSFGRYGSQFRFLAENLRSLDAATSLRLYRRFAADESPHLRAVGIYGLIAANDPEGPKRAAAELKELAASADVQPIAASLSSYCNASDLEAVRAIATLATQDLPIPLLKEHTSYALRSLHAREAMPALIALLDSDQSTVRANALAGICLFIRNAPTVTPDATRTMSWMTSHAPTPFRNAETDRFCWMGGPPEEAARLIGHVAFWKAWWQAHQSEALSNSR